MPDYDTDIVKLYELSVTIVKYCDDELLPIFDEPHAAEELAHRLMEYTNQE